MICQRCGVCCCNSTVIIIHPDFIKEKLNINKLPNEAFLLLNSEKCPHQSWDGDISICAIHHYKWYKKTPCYTHGQIERSKDDPCRTGVYMRSNPDIWKKLIKFRTGEDI